MKETRYTEEQINGAIKEHETGAKSTIYAASWVFPAVLSTTGVESTPAWK